MSLFPAYRGVRILPFMEKLRYFIFSFFFLLFSPILGFYIYQNFTRKVILFSKEGKGI